MIFWIGSCFFTLVFGVMVYVKLSQINKARLKVIAEKEKIKTAEKIINERKQIAQWNL